MGIRTMKIDAVIINIPKSKNWAFQSSSPFSLVPSILGKNKEVFLVLVLLRLFFNDFLSKDSKLES